MVTPSANEPLKNGTMVKILHSQAGPARIVEYRGRLAPGGRRVYGLRFGHKPSHYTERPEDILEVIPSEEETAAP